MSSIPREVDVVVAGSGAAGLAAAVTLAEGGATVAVFEKQRSLGGTSNFFHGTFAVRARTVMLGTKGGIRINERTEVVDTTGAVISGLCAGGFDAGGMYGDSYPIHVSSGLSSAFAINSGRIAGRNALQYVG